MEIHTGTKQRGEEVGRNRPSMSARPSSLRLSCSLLDYNSPCTITKDTKRGSNINRQKYTELIFTCLVDVRKSSYTHTKSPKQKEKRTLSDL